MATVKQTERKRREHERLTARLTKGLKPERIVATLPSRKKKGYSTTTNLVAMSESDKNKLTQTIARLKDKIDNPKKKVSLAS